MAESAVSVPQAIWPSWKVRISVVVPVWNGRGHLEKLLKTVAAQTVQAADVTVVDNGSTDGVGGFAEQWGAKVVRFAENRGFAAAVNRGVAESGGELLAILNSDVELEPRWMELLVEAITRNSASFATGLIVSAANPDLIDGSWDLVSKAGMPWRAGSGFGTGNSAFQSERAISLAPFTAILVRRELWEQVGPLDERFESYLEDVDFGLRCAAAGRRGVYVPSALCRHVGSAALGRWGSDSVRRISRNQVFLVEKYISPGRRRGWWWKVLVGQGLWGLVAARHGAGAAWWGGKWEGWKRRGEFRGNMSLAEPDFKSQEREIFALQQELGLDFYWRWYGRLTGIEAE